ncbi:methyltransferase domain-containing protein [Prochlorococcus sp. AH-736-B04]|nr:methyltransferase domain-containing protein [Prochlorococcus sp. AH-736-B04]
MGWQFDYFEKTKSYQENDYWRQVRRTIKGQPVSQEQINLIVEQITKLLDLKIDDNLLDFGCGNGALTTYFKAKVATTYGIDSSEYLIKIANKNFSTIKNKYEIISIQKFIENRNIIKFNKFLMYGVSSFLEDNELETIFKSISRKKNIIFMIGNIRDIKSVDSFYEIKPSIKELNSCKSSMGKWRDLNWFEKMATKYNLVMESFKMPINFYARDYYFDIILKK